MYLKFVDKIIDQTPKFKIFKGPIISEGNCGVLNFPKNQQNYFKDFCPSL